jgi:hypothetical protein
VCRRWESVEPLEVSLACLSGYRRGTRAGARARGRRGRAAWCAGGMDEGTEIRPHASHDARKRSFNSTSSMAGSLGRCHQRSPAAALSSPARRVCTDLRSALGPAMGRAQVTGPRLIPKGQSLLLVDHRDTYVTRRFSPRQLRHFCTFWAFELCLPNVEEIQEKDENPKAPAASHTISFIPCGKLCTHICTRVNILCQTLRGPLTMPCFVASTAHWIVPSPVIQGTGGRNYVRQRRMSRTPDLAALHDRSFRHHHPARRSSSSGARPYLRAHLQVLLCTPSISS